MLRDYDEHPRICDCDACINGDWEGDLDAPVPYGLTEKGRRELEALLGPLEVKPLRSRLTLHGPAGTRRAELVGFLGLEGRTPAPAALLAVGRQHAEVELRTGRCELGELEAAELLAVRQAWFAEWKGGGR